jgi:hypothetical protein
MKKKADCQAVLKNSRNRYTLTRNIIGLRVFHGIRLVIGLLIPDNRKRPARNAKGTSAKSRLFHNTCSGKEKAKKNMAKNNIINLIFDMLISI